MNPIIAILGIIFVLAMLIFGHGPADEYLKKKLKPGRDPLVEAIEEHNKKKDPKSMMGHFGMSKSEEEGPVNTGADPAHPAEVPPDVPRATTFMRPTYQQQPTASAPQQAAPASTNSYYPPPAGPGQGSTLQQQPAGQAPKTLY